MASVIAVELQSRKTLQKSRMEKLFFFRYKRPTPRKPRPEHKPPPPAIHHTEEEEEEEEDDEGDDGGDGEEEDDDDV